MLLKPLYKDSSFISQFEPRNYKPELVIFISVLKDTQLKPSHLIILAIITVSIAVE